MRSKLVVSERLDEMLIKRGFSRRSFAKIIGIGEATVVQICNGHRNPSPKTARKIAEALQVDWDELFVIRKSLGTPLSSERYEIGGMEK